MLIAVVGGWTALRLTGSLSAVFATVSGALVVYGLIMLVAIAGGSWTRATR